jgi:hypothetical protein
MSAIGCNLQDNIQRSVAGPVLQLRELDDPGLTQNEKRSIKRPISRRESAGCARHHKELEELQTRVCCSLHMVWMQLEMIRATISPIYKFPERLQNYCIIAAKHVSLNSLYGIAERKYKNTHLPALRILTLFKETK